MNGKKHHETQSGIPERYPERNIPENGAINEELLEIQKIEGGGPPKKVVLQDLPLPIRIFAVFFSICVIIMGIFGVVMTVLD